MLRSNVDSNVAKTRLMIVEDEAIVALDIQNRLRLLGYDVPAVVSSGEEAVDMADQSSPDLILMDIMLEGALDGIEAAAIIRDRYSIPVVYLTAYADENTLQRAKITEPFGYIIKPFEDRELNITIEMALYKHRLERKLVENERWLATTLRSIGDGVVTTDHGGRVRFINPVAEALIGRSQAEILGRKLDEILHVQDDSVRTPLPDLALQVLSEGRAIKLGGSRTLLSREGGSVPINVNISPIRDQRGQVIGTVLVFRDITERCHAEKALQDSVTQLQLTLEETVNALAVTSEKRDPYTAGHQQRVSRLACAIADRLGIQGDAVEGIRVGGILHDIGKIYVPAEILSKPALLTSMEMGIMKTHSEVGFDILKSIPFPWPVAQIVLQHHERIDGSGYPQGISGADILPEARILAVADVVEAMSSHRPYRAALGIERALEEISKNKGRLYDTDAVDACLFLFREVGFSFDADIA